MTKWPLCFVNPLLSRLSGGDDRGRVHGGVGAARPEREPARGGDRQHVARAVGGDGVVPRAPQTRPQAAAPHRHPLWYVTRPLRYVTQPLSTLPDHSVCHPTTPVRYPTTPVRYIQLPSRFRNTMAMLTQMKVQKCSQFCHAFVFVTKQSLRSEKTRFGLRGQVYTSLPLPLPCITEGTLWSGWGGGPFHMCRGGDYSVLQSFPQFNVTFSLNIGEIPEMFGCN